MTTIITLIKTLFITILLLILSLTHAFATQIHHAKAKKTTTTTKKATIKNKSTTSLTVVMQKTDPGLQPIGTITLKETPFGILIIPDIYDVAFGIHGFHVHVNSDCSNAGMAAGGHYDPKKTNRHLGPYNTNGHLGDLPALTADTHGNITLPVLAPRIHSLEIFLNHALIIHQDGDNYSDHPKPLGGGGPRIACGIIS